jgi:PIN domain nuclease of toxin-antitoxin system
MRYLLDSSVWFRSALREQTIPKEIQRILNPESELLGLSVFSLWEAAKKHQRGKLLLPMEISAWLKQALSRQIAVLPLTPEIIVDSASLPEFPNRDPADELIVATARVNQLTLLTTDRLLKDYPHVRVQYFKPLSD